MSKLWLLPGSPSVLPVAPTRQPQVPLYQLEWSSEEVEHLGGCSVLPTPLLGSDSCWGNSCVGGSLVLFLRVCFFVSFFSFVLFFCNFTFFF